MKHYVQQNSSISLDPSLTPVHCLKTQIKNCDHPNVKVLMWRSLRHITTIIIVYPIPSFCAPGPTSREKKVSIKFVKRRTVDVCCDRSFRVLSIGLTYIVFG